MKDQTLLPPFPASDKAFKKWANIKAVARSSLLSGFVVAFCWQAWGQIYDTNNDRVQIFAGSPGSPGLLNGQGTQALFSGPSAVVADSSSNLFVLDRGNSLIRRITPAGSVSTFAGGGSGILPGIGTSVSLSSFSLGSMSIDYSNTMWIIVGGGLLRVGNDASVEFLAYSGVYSYSSGICVDSGNNLYFSTPNGNQIYRLGANGTLTLFAGNGSSGKADGNGAFASFNGPAALGADAADNIYVWDSGNSLVRRIDQNQNVTTIAGSGFRSDSDGIGTSASFNSIAAMCVDGFGNVILACGSSIRKITAATNVTTIAGSFSQSSYANGVGALARFYGASGVFLSQGMIFVADSGNQCIRQIAFNPSPQLVSAPNLGLNTYPGLTITGLVGRAYQIQSSPDMSTWGTVTTLLLTSSPYLWIDQNPIAGNKYYRAFLLP